VGTRTRTGAGADADADADAGADAGTSSREGTGTGTDAGADASTGSRAGGGSRAGRSNAARSVIVQHRGDANTIRQKPRRSRGEPLRAQDAWFAGFVSLIHCVDTCLM